jgi:exonuclease III/ribosomal protein S28E/S33
MKHQRVTGQDLSAKTHAKRKRNNDLQLNSWNVRTLSGPGELQALVYELKHYRCNVTAVQETRWTGASVFDCNGFLCMFSSDKSKPWRYGTGFIVDPKWRHHVMDFTEMGGRLCVLRLRGKFFNYSIINVYAPHNERTNEEKDTFYALLEKTYCGCPRNDVKVIIGDVNAQIGREKAFKSIIGSHSLHKESNENGIRLINFAAMMNMVISSTRFQRSNIHKHTYAPVGGGKKTQIDHVLVDGRHASDVLNVRTYKATNIDIEHHDSDHYLLGVKIRARVSNMGRSKATRCQRFDVAKLGSSEVKDAFNQKLDEELTSWDVGELSWRQCREIVTKAAEECLGRVVPTKNPWFDDECQQAVQRVIDARKRIITRASQGEVRRLQREKKKLLRQKKREHEHRVIAEIEEMQSANESRKYFMAIKKAKSSFQPRVAICRAKEGELICNRDGVLDRWKQNFEDLLNGNFTESQYAPARLYENDDRKEVPMPSIEEVELAVNRLKNNKSPGADELPAELFKTGNKALIESLHAIIAQTWENEKLPEEWLLGVICPLHKKGDILDCGNYRGISLLQTAYKALAKLLSMRVEPYYENYLHEFQSGFRKQKSTIDQIHNVRQIIQKSYGKNVETFHLFVDFRAAYDSVDREGLWRIMSEGGFPNKLIRLLKATLTNVRCCVKVQGSLSSEFEAMTGLRQGDELSTKLFNIALEGVCRRAKVEMQGTIFKKSSQLLGFADDIDIVGRNLRSISDTYSRLEKEANKMGLRVNEDKTKFLMVAASERTRSMVGSHLVINEKRFEVVNEFVYLGSLVTSDFSTTVEVRRRILSGLRAYFSLKNLLASKKLSRSTKLRMYKALIRPVVLYGSETWNTTKADEEALAVFERKVLRTVFGPIKENDIYRIRHNDELYQLFREADIVRILQLNRLRWAGHVIRRPEDAPVHAIFKADFNDGKRSRGRQKNSWTDNVDNDAEVLGIREWRKVAKDRPKFRKLLDAAKGPRA